MGIRLNVGVVSVLRDFSSMWKVFLDEETTIMQNDEKIDKEVEKLKKQSDEYVLKLEDSITKNYPTVVSNKKNPNQKSKSKQKQNENKTK